MMCIQQEQLGMTFEGLKGMKLEVKEEGGNQAVWKNATSIAIDDLIVRVWKK